MFGLPVSEYPILHKRKKELNLLNKLYSLYLLVLKKINSYSEILWQSVYMDVILAEISDFQIKCRQLPKGMQTWNAYIELKQKIDDFNEMCPLLELMVNKSMKLRHWEQISEITNYDFDIENPRTTVGHVLEAPLLKHKDEIQVYFDKMKLFHCLINKFQRFCVGCVYCRRQRT